MSWLDRQSFLGKDSDEIFKNLTIGFAGLGGGGSQAAQQLAHVGVGNFVLIDDDFITDTNLNRLVGGTRADVDVKARKVDIAERLIKAINPSAQVDKHDLKWQAAFDALKKCDIVIGGLDSVRAKDEIDAFTRRFMIPYLDMGMDVHENEDGSYLIAGQVVLTGPGEPCLRCLGIVTDEGLGREAANYGAAGGKPQVVWPNGILASIAVGLCVQLVTPWHRDCVSSAFIEYDGNRNTTKEAQILAWSKKRGCMHYKADDVGDPLFDIRKSLAIPAIETLQKPIPHWYSLENLRRFFSRNGRVKKNGG